MSGKLPCCHHKLCQFKIKFRIYVDRSLFWHYISERPCPVQKMIAHKLRYSGDIDRPVRPVISILCLPLGSPALLNETVQRILLPQQSAPGQRMLQFSHGDDRKSILLAQDPIRPGDIFRRAHWRRHNPRRGRYGSGRGGHCQPGLGGAP